MNDTNRIRKEGCGMPDVLTDEIIRLFRHPREPVWQRHGQILSLLRSERRMRRKHLWRLPGFFH